MTNIFMGWENLSKQFYLKSDFVKNFLYCRTAPRLQALEWRRDWIPDQWNCSWLQELTNISNLWCYIDGSLFVRRGWEGLVAMNPTEITSKTIKLQNWHPDPAQGLRTQHLQGFQTPRNGSSFLFYLLFYGITMLNKYDFNY